MNKDGLLRSIAETAYNVGFGAKKHFATFDMVEKLPGVIGFLSIAVGILSLVIDQLSSKVPSAGLTIAGVAALYMSFYDHKKADYDRTGKELTGMFNELRNLYRQVESGADLGQSLVALKEIEVRFQNASISNQAWLSDWYAHYKFFSQQQIEWIDKELKFRWTDKVPVSLRVWLVVLVLGLIGVLAYSFLPCFDLR
ncbi:MAG: SLATT domain-containing protein [Hyphomonas sp.]|nr:SLATT domain-containing protein [Hyphomonas sp.]